MLRLTRYTSAARFLADAEPFLLQAEAENALLLGVAHELASASAAPASPPWFATLSHAAGPALCAFSTMPGRLGITRGGGAAAWALLAQDLDAAGLAIDAVLGPDPDAAECAGFFAARSGRRPVAQMAHRIHELRELAPLARAAPGALRPAQPEDLAVVTTWVAGFLRDIGEPGDAKAVAEHKIAAGQLFLWEQGGAVSMAGWAGKTPNGVRVNFVYTPEAERGKGYATACTAALTALLLQRGNRFCCLYTDLANPTSNAIYARIGYRPVCDGGLYQLGARSWEP